MFSWLKKLFSGKKSVKYWVHIHVDGSAEVISGTEGFPPEEATTQIIKGLSGTEKYTAGSLQALAKKYHFTDEANAKALLKKVNAGKKSADEPKPASPKPAGDSPVDDYEKWAATQAAQVDQGMGVDDFLATVMGSESSPKKPSAAKPAAQTSPAAAEPNAPTLQTAIGIRFDHQAKTFAFINRKFKPNDQLPRYANEKDLQNAREGKNLDVIATLIFRDQEHAIEMKKALISAGYKHQK